MSLNVFADYIENCKEYGKEPSWEGLRAYKTMHSKSKKQVRPCMPNKKIVNGIIDNEIAHIQEHLELDFTKNNIDCRQAALMTEIIHKALSKGMTEKQIDLLDELCSSIANEWIELCRFYFREGLRAGLTNLKFLNEIDNVEYMI